MTNDQVIQRPISLIECEKLLKSGEHLTGIEAQGWPKGCDEQHKLIIPGETEKIRHLRKYIKKGYCVDEIEPRDWIYHLKSVAEVAVPVVLGSVSLCGAKKISDKEKNIKEEDKRKYQIAKAALVVIGSSGLAIGVIKSLYLFFSENG